MDEKLRVVVVGAGIGGLASALAFSRAGHRVTLVERDDTPMPPDVEGAFDWRRSGAPQVRHPHAFLGLGRTILRDRFPDVLRALTDKGVRTVSMQRMAGMSSELADRLDADDDLRALGCRRTTFEWVLRRCVLAEANIELRVGVGVSGLLARPGEGSVPVVIGVRLEGGASIEADLVVASTGRRSDLPRWLADHGVAVTETEHDTGVVYFSRWYRADEENEFGFRFGLGGGLAVGVIGADAGTYSITAVVDKDDKELRAHLNDSDRFDATMRLLPQIADVIEFGGRPFHPVHCMTGLINRLRRYTDSGGNPLAVGVLAVGDAHTCTNPAYGRGQSLALLQAVMAADAVADSTDLATAGRQYEAQSAARVEPWFHFSVLSDQMRPRVPGDAVAGAAGPSAGAGGLDIFGAASAATADPDLVHLLLRVVNLLELPDALWTRLPELQRSAAEAAAAAASRRAGRPQRPRPSRDEILAVVA